MQSQVQQIKSISNPETAAAGNIEQLQSELARIDVLIRREVRRWQLAGQDMDDIFRGQYLTDKQADALLARPTFTSWGQTVTSPTEEDKKWEQALLDTANHASKISQAVHDAGKQTCLDYLADTFHLDSFDIDILLICLAPSLDPRYERLYGYLQDDLTRKRASINLLLDLLCPPGYERICQLEHFLPTAPLIRYHLLEFLPDWGPQKQPLIGCGLKVNETVFAWLLGSYQPGENLAGFAKISYPQLNPEDWMCAGDWLNQGKTIQDLPEEPVFIFYGPDEVAQEASARILASLSHKPLLVIDLPGALNEGNPAMPLVQMALRDAYLFGAIPYLSGWDALLKESKVTPDLLQELCNFHKYVIVSGQETWQISGLERQRIFRWQSFTIPPYQTRRDLWAYFLGEKDRQEDEIMDMLAEQFTLSCGQIRDAVAMARDLSAPLKSNLDANSLFSAARAHSSPNLIGLARKLTPRYGWTDIVLPADQIDQLHEIVATVRGRPVVLDDWGIGRKLSACRGVAILFSGPPGTGKTMAAEVIAKELGLDLYKIDLSTIVSKYIGETEKNMERIFSEAESSNAILFFDEADALFGKRSEVRDSHDRYANIEISYLLQRMEIYDGVTILATNLRSNLDESFTRRLQFAVEFPFPEDTYRLRIWQTLFPSQVPQAPNLDFAWFAKRFKLAGGNIRNIIVGAAYLAHANGGQVSMDHLLHTTRRELQKMGRLVSENDLDMGNDLMKETVSDDR
jgi:ATP-dependent 26S proteasome regulatory subunit